MDRRANPRLYDEIQDTDKLSLVSHFNSFILEMTMSFQIHAIAVS